MRRDQRLLALRDRVAQAVLERIRADAAAAPWPHRGLLLELAKDLFNGELRIGKLWTRLRQSDHSMSTRFAKQLGRTPKEYLDDRRMEVAAGLLLSAEIKVSVETVGELVGQRDLRTFQRGFQRVFDTTPAAFRERGREPPPEAVQRSRPCAPEHGITRTFEDLLQRSRALGRNNRVAGVELAQQALASLQARRSKMPREDAWAQEARGWAWLANAKRRACDPQGAWEALLRSKAALTKTQDLSVEKELLNIEVAWLLDQYRLDEALVGNERVLALSARPDTQPQLIEALLHRCEILSLMGKVEAAIAVLEVTTPLSAGSTPHLKLSLRQHLAVTYLQTSRTEAALQLFPINPSLAESTVTAEAAASEHWLEGFLEAGMGNWHKAVEHLEKLRGRFLAQADVGREALLLLDLAHAMRRSGQQMTGARLASEGRLLITEIGGPLTAILAHPSPLQCF